MADEFGPYIDAYGDDVEWAHRAGCLRITDGTLVDDPTDPDFLVCDGLYIHGNYAHINIGIKSVQIEKASGYIWLHTDGALNGAPILTGDETAARDRLMFGASGGNGHIKIIASDENGFVNLANQSEYNALASAGLNLWFAFHSPKNRAGDPSRMSELEGRVAEIETGLEAALARIAVLENATPTVNVSVACASSPCTPCEPPSEDG